MNKKTKQKQVYQFKISLLDVQPSIWRRVQVPEEYSFWDLHVAIQDAMGWTDSHLHQFRVTDPSYIQNKKIYIGIPDEDADVYYNSPETFPGWKKFIRNYFSLKDLDTCYYDYDFGDDWGHKVKLEKILTAVSGVKYPICMAGKRACPPEDCGGIPGYERFLEIINDPKHEEYQSMLDWVGGSFDPEEFNPKEVLFENPKERWKFVFEG